MADDGNIVIIGFLIFVIIWMLIGFVVVPYYKESIAEEIVFRIAQQQTQTGNIFYLDNQTVRTVSVRELCGS